MAVCVAAALAMGPPVGAGFLKTSAPIVFWGYGVMKKAILFLITLAALFSLVSGCAAAANNTLLWEFSKFKNTYSLYEEAKCYVEEKRACQRELSWQGNEISFFFNISR